MTGVDKSGRDGRPASVAAFMRANLPIRAVPGLPSLRLHQAGPHSGLSRITRDTPPYWAHLWGGGLALARHLTEHRETVRGRRVLDLGAGSGLVAIAAAKAGARHVLASDSDPDALAAVAVHAALNGVAIDIVPGDLLDGPPPDVDLVAVGDLFYEAALARRVVTFLTRCVEAGIDILVGDPFRTALPYERLRPVTEYEVRDFGDTQDRKADVFAFIGEATP